MRLFCNLRFLLWVIAFSAVTTGAARGQNVSATPPAGSSGEPVTRLEEFIVNESARANDGDLRPTSRPVFSVFGEQSVVDVPRSVTVLTPDIMEQLHIEDFSDLDKIGPGTQQINYYGVPGTPALRGARGSVYFDGMQRAFQRNEMPLSFGSLDAMDVVRGPAPAHFGPALVGGYVNLIPKSPYFDHTRGALRVETDTFGTARAQIDVGGPTLLGDRPAAYRVSLTGQNGKSYYDGIDNDFVSLYGALKTQLSSRLSVFTGGEYFRFRSNENAGWNRPTQDLIDHGNYIIGEPLSIASPAWGGVADRTLLRVNPALVVPAATVDAGISSGFITTTQRDAMLNLSDASERAQAYTDFSPAQLASVNASTSGYQYTPAYFAAGGKVFTAPVAGHTVLTDQRDYANSENVLYFLDVENALASDRTLKAQFLVDHIDTTKLSTYGYAIATRQTVSELKLSMHEAHPSLAGLDLTYGVSARHTDAWMLQDFTVEPFSRRDITNPEVSPNTIILSGPQEDPAGLNFWSATAQGGANAHSQLWQLSAFAYATNRITDRLRTYTSLLVAHAPYSTRYPAEVDHVPADDPRRTPVSDHQDYYSASFSPTWSVAPAVNLYVTAQYGTAIDPLQGGAIVGRGNFTRNRLYEAGAKTALGDGKLFAGVAVFDWRQTQYNERENNAELVKGQGIELEFTWVPNATVSLLGSIDHQRVNRLSDLGFRSIPLTAEQIALHGGVLNSNFSGIPPAPGTGTFARPTANPTLEYPGTPETQLKLFAVVHVGGGFGFSAGPIVSASYWHNFDHTLRLPSSVVWNGNLFYHAESWDATVSFDNITNADYFLGAEPVFGANTLLTKAPGASARLALTYRF